MFRGKAFDEVELGEKFSDTMTVTETHMTMACCIFKDSNFLHTNEVFARETIFSGRVVPGPLTAGVMGGLIGNFFRDTTVAFLEQSTCFKAPVRPGDTLTTEWEIVQLEPKRKYNGGIVSLKATCTNQNGVLVAEGQGKILVMNRAK